MNVRFKLLWGTFSSFAVAAAAVFLFLYCYTAGDDLVYSVDDFAVSSVGGNQLRNDLFIHS